MRENYEAGPGRYEGLSLIEAFMVDHVDSLADEASGSTEAPTGWFALVQRPNVNPIKRRAHIIGTDSLGFWFVTTWTGPNATNDAGAMFDAMDIEFSAWCDDNDC